VLSEASGCFFFAVIEMPKVKGKRARVGGNARGSRTREATIGPRPRASAAANLDLRARPLSRRLLVLVKLR